MLDVLAPKQGIATVYQQKAATNPAHQKKQGPPLKGYPTYK